MRKVHKKLTKDQIERGIVFSSTLSKATTEMKGDVIHEVHKDEPDKERIIRNLKDDKFFENSPWKYNIIRS